MADFILSSESVMDRPYAWAQSRDISVIFYKYEVDGKTFEDNMERDPAATEEFYRYIDEGHIPTTSQINQFTYEEYFRSLLAQGKDVLHLCLSTGFTGSYNNAVNAAEELKEEFPDRKLYVVDTYCGSCGLGYYMEFVADKRDEGLSIDELYQWAMDFRLKVHHIFTNPDLSYFKRTGRLTGPAATLASVLNIVPVMHLNGEGRLIAYDKYRGKKKAYQHFMDEMARLADGGEDYCGRLAIGHARCPEDVEMIKQMLMERFPKAGEPAIYNIGPIIVSHCGPGTISFYFIGKERE